MRFLQMDMSLASGGNDGAVYLWDVGTGERLNTLTAHRRYIHSVLFSPDGKTLASTSHDWYPPSRWDSPSLGRKYRGPS